MKIRYAPIMAATALTVILSACEPPMSATKEAIVATVGDEVIGETELKRAVSRLGKLDETESAQVRGKVLEALVDQRLVSGAARIAKLDTEPEVVLALQQAQRQVLVEAYMERLFKDMAQPSDSEINDYYTRHPELFSARRIYRIQQLDLQMASSRLPEVEARLKQSRDLADFSDWLRSQGIVGKAGVVVKPAEQLPAAILARLRNMKDGQVALLAMDPERVSVLQLQDSQAQPVSLEQAREAIERVLQGEKRKAVVEAEIKKLRSSGKIKYSSGFSPAVASPQGGKPSEQTSRP